jgi:hypothetical protein
MMRTNLELPKGDLESMHPMLKNVGEENNKAISQLWKELYVKGHLGD